MRRLLSHARPLPVTCHTAFDETPDVEAALDQLVALGVDRVLTSGGAASAEAGTATLAALADVQLCFDYSMARTDPPLAKVEASLATLKAIVK